MNIYATKGHKVIAKNLDWGYPEDIRKAAKYLTRLYCELYRCWWLAHGREISRV